MNKFDKVETIVLIALGFLVVVFWEINIYKLDVEPTKTLAAPVWKIQVE